MENEDKKNEEPAFGFVCDVSTVEGGDVAIGEEDLPVRPVEKEE